MPQSLVQHSCRNLWAMCPRLRHQERWAGYIRI
jgi:hypothetical protein